MADEKQEREQSQIWHATFDDGMRDAMITIWQHARDTVGAGEALDAAVVTLKPWMPKEAGGDWVERTTAPTPPPSIPVQ